MRRIRLKTTILIILCVLLYLMVAYSSALAQGVKIPDGLIQKIKECLTCDEGSTCKVVIGDNNYYYLFNIKDDKFSLIKAVKNKGQKITQINDTISKWGWELCKGVLIYGGKFRSGFAHWDLDKQYKGKE